VNNTN